MLASYFGTLSTHTHQEYLTKANEASAFIHPVGLSKLDLHRLNKL